jgi:hypothetical protein
MTSKAHARISLLLSRMHDIQRIFGTIKNVAMIDCVFCENPELDTPWLSESDIIIFRRIVETGILKQPIFRPPVGHEVLGFLIALKDAQERQRAVKFEAYERELTEMVAERLFLFFVQHNGNLEAAKYEMADKFKNHNEYTRGVFNQAYLIAKKQWENHVNPN